MHAAAGGAGHGAPESHATVRLGAGARLAHGSGAADSAPYWSSHVTVRERVPAAHVREHAPHGPLLHAYARTMHGAPDAAAHGSADGGAGAGAHSAASTESCVAASRQATVRDCTPEPHVAEHGAHAPTEYV